MNTKGLIYGLIAGLTIGIAAVLMITPEKKKEFRNKFDEKKKEYKDRFSDYIDDINERNFL